MPAPSDRPLRKVTINLYEEDLVELERRIGWGWSEIIRNLLHDYIRTSRPNIISEFRTPSDV